MSRQKPTVPQSAAADNGEAVGDAFEPTNASGETLSFNPAELETDTPASPDRSIFDPEFLALSQDFAAEVNVARTWDTIKVEKPSKERVFRVHPTMRLKTILLVKKEDNEVYLVHPQLRQVLARESLCGQYTLFPYVTKAGTPFLWPIRMADKDGKWNIWHQTAWQIAEKAQTRWARMQANRDAGYYIAEYDQRPPEQQQLPEWPELKFCDWLELAFKGFTIDSMDHPLLRRLHMKD